MATMIKGLQYFPLSVDFYEDDIVYLLVSDYGLESVSVLLKLICKISVSYTHLTLPTNRLV